MLKLANRVIKIERAIRPKRNNIIFAHSESEANRILKEKDINPYEPVLIYIVGKINKPSNSGL